jgi:hypothetical protein
VSRAVRHVLALSFVLVAAQSCVLERLAADRSDPSGEAGNDSGAGTAGDASAGGSSTSAGAAGSSSGGVGSAGGSSAAGKGGDGGGGSGGGDGGSAGNTGSAGDGSEGGGGGEPDASWVRCDPTFAADAYLECPSLEPNIGEYCDSENVFIPSDHCVYCENPAACPVQTAYVILQCANRAWRAGTGSGIGCCPNKLPVHGTACEGSALCDYGVSDSCECFDGKWQCCPDAYDGGVCSEPGKQCVVNYGDDMPDRCTCAGPANAEVWSCCPVSAPMTGDVCYTDVATCTYPQRSCTCASYGSSWSCN